MLSRVCVAALRDRKSTRLNSSHTVIYTLSLHDALPISQRRLEARLVKARGIDLDEQRAQLAHAFPCMRGRASRSEEHTSELQSHSDLHSFPTRRSSDLAAPPRGPLGEGSRDRSRRAASAARACFPVYAWPRF